MINSTLKKRIKENITNLSNMGIIPADEVTLNLDVIYNSVLDRLCSIVPMNSPSQIISCLKLTYESNNKTLIKTNNIEKDAVGMLAMNGVGAVPYNDQGYPTEDVICTINLNAENKFVLSYDKIIPGTLKIDDVLVDKYADGNIYINDNIVGSIDYDLGIITNNDKSLNNKEISYKFNIYNLMTNRNLVKFTKTYQRIFVDMYQLDLDYALNLNSIKTLSFKDNIENIIPQVLSAQIDQYIINKYFKQAENNKIDTWNGKFTWGNQNAPASLYIDDLGSYINSIKSDFVLNHGVLPNVLIVDPIAYGIISSNRKFIHVNDKEENNYYSAGLPKFVGYLDGCDVILSKQCSDNVNIILTYNGIYEAQSAGVYTPYIPIQIRNIYGAEGQGMIGTLNAYSLGGFSIINPDLIRGIKILD